MLHPLQFIRKHSLLSGIASGALIALLTAGIITTNVSHTSAATANGCNGSSSTRPAIHPGDSGNCVMLAQQLLAQMGYFNTTANGHFGPATQDAVLRLQADRGLNQLGFVGPKTWAALDGSGSTTASSSSGDTTVSDDSSLPSSCLTTSKTICVVKSYGSEGTLYAVQNRQIVRSFPIRTGDGRGPDYVTVNGVHSVTWKDIDHKSSEFDGAPMDYSLFFYGGEAIHYSDDFAQNGYGGLRYSHGCVNVGSRADAAWLYNWSPVGTRVVVTN